MKVLVITVEVLESWRARSMGDGFRKNMLVVLICTSVVAAAMDKRLWKTKPIIVLVPTMVVLTAMKGDAIWAIGSWS